MIKITGRVQDVFGATVEVGHDEFGSLILDGKAFTPHQADELVKVIAEALSAAYEPIHDEGTSYCTSLPEHGHDHPDYPHNPANTTCPGPGIKCLCWDIDNS